MENGFVTLMLVEVVFFILTMALVLNKRTAVAGEYVGIAFHLLLFVPVARVPASFIGRSGGLIWIACDVIASTGKIWMAREREESSQAVFHAIRMAGHLFAAVWVGLASMSLGLPGKVVGLLLAFSFATYTLAAGRIPEKALALAGPLMIAWLLLITRTVH